MFSDFPSANVSYKLVNAQFWHIHSNNIFNMLERTDLLLVTCRCLRSDVDIFVRVYDRMKDREDNEGDEVYF